MILTLRRSENTLKILDTLSLRFVFISNFMNFLLTVAISNLVLHPVYKVLHVAWQLQ